MQEACREMVRGDLFSKDQMADSLPSELISRELPFFKAFLILNNIGKELPIDLNEQRRGFSRIEMLMSAALLCSHVLDLHHDLQMDPDYVLRSLETRCLYDEDVWEFVQNQGLILFSPAEKESLII